MSLAWISKATTQAAFATVPLLTLTAWVAENPGATWKGCTGPQLILYGQQIQWCCVLSIFIGTPLGTIFQINGAPYLLEKVVPDAGAPLQAEVAAACAPAAPALVEMVAVAPPAAAGGAELSAQQTT